MKYAFASLLGIYFLFTSGLIYQLFTPTIINHLESPYSLGLSAEKNGIAAIATEDDMQAVKWLEANANGRMIKTDYNGLMILRGYLDDSRITGDLSVIEQGELIFVDSWSMEHKKYIEPCGVGVRQAIELPDFGSSKILFQNKAEVLEK